MLSSFFFFFLFCKGGVGTISNIISVRDEEEIWKMYNYYSLSNLNLLFCFLSLYSFISFRMLFLKEIKKKLEE